MKYIIYNSLIIFAVLLLLLFIIKYFYDIYNDTYNNVPKECFEWSNCNLLDQQKLVNTFEKNGVIIIPDFFPPEYCDELLEIIKKKENGEYKKNENETRTETNSEYKRQNIVMPIKECKKYIMDLCNKITYFTDVLTPNPVLIDCAAFITEPGCYPQVWHADTVNDKQTFVSEKQYANQISMGIALQDIDEPMGPLEAILETNNLNYRDFHHRLKIKNLNNNYDSEGVIKDCIYKDDNIKRGLCKNVCFESTNLDKKYKHVKCDCKKGSLVMWSSKVFHRGGQNYGNKNRPVFYITLMGDNGKPPIHFESTIEDSSKKIYIKDL